MAADGKEVDTLIRKATLKGRQLGTERFIKKLEKERLVAVFCQRRQIGQAKRGECE